MSRYRNDVDGLRAVAVLFVLAFHLGVGGVGGGFVGVDVFFVISGYLITGIINNSIINGTFSFISFYERRARRILPALLVVVAASAVLGGLFLFPGDYKVFGWSALYTLAAVSNIFFMLNTGYFDIASQNMPLLHTWSLSVEEQFYFVWPAVILGTYYLFKGSRRALFAALLIILIVGFVGALFQVRTDPKVAFYAPYTRAWELAIGGLLLFISSPVRVKWWFAESLGILGIISIGWSTFTLSASDPFPGLNALPSVLGAAMILYSGSIARTKTSEVLGGSIPAFIGRISYSLYLWHWPLIVFYRQYSGASALTAIEMICISTVSFLLSVVSWRYVEQPLRRVRLRTRAVFAIALAAELVLAAGFAAVVLNDGFTGRIHPEMAALLSKEKMWNWACPQRLDVGLLRYQGLTPAPTCIVGDQWETAKRHALIWGDSIAEAMLPLFDYLGRQKGISIALVDTCPAVIAESYVRRHVPELPNYNHYCEAQRAAALKTLRSTPFIDTVVLTASWTFLPSLVERSDTETRSREKGIELLREAFQELLPRLSADGRKVVILADIPVWGVDPTICVLARAGLMRRPCRYDATQIARIDFEKLQGPIYQLIREAAARSGAQAHFPADFLCDATRCSTFLGGEFLYRDAVHLRRNLPGETLEELVERVDLKRIFEADRVPNSDR